ncbi:MAG: thioredoxin family protein [Bacteroidota bacterium]|nr:thioredoxin family protein [Bacteroidota bacterium]
MNKRILLTALIAVLAIFTSNAQAPSVGQKATDLSYNDPNGTPISLSSLKGNIVLLDFWASWCGPCRRNNPAVVALYNKYQGKKWNNKAIKGFTVYSVSLDQSADAWKQAIQQDGLVWKNHVSDLKGWSSEGAAKYGIRSIPQTVLIDETGFVIAQNPPHELVDEILGKKLLASKAKKTKTVKK